jgi:hypothetical protein
MAAGTTGQVSTNGCVESTIPPGCWEAWRGRPSASAPISTSRRQRTESARRSPIAIATSRRSASEPPW